MLPLAFLDQSVELRQAATVAFTLVVWCTVLLGTVSRNPTVQQQRLQWDEYVVGRSNQPEIFKRHLRMDLASFKVLLEIIRADLEVDARMAALRGGPIIPELCLFCTLRYLAGGSYLDIHDRTGISRSSFYRVLWKTCKAIAKSNTGDLAFPWPNSKADCQSIARGFESKSFRGIIKNCVGAIDGWLLPIITPSRLRVGNVRSYFSGHYQCYGINVQAVCDSQCRFTYFALAGPGVMNDNDALHQIDLYEKIVKLAEYGFFCIIADAAYIPTEQIVPIYQGVDKNNKKYDNFNFFASQMRIRIEMAYGMMTKKWGILKRPAECSLKNLKWQMLAIARLHNFCINRRIADPDHDYDASGGMDYMSSVPMNDYDDLVYPPLSDEFPGLSMLREVMADQVEEAGLVRPRGNRLRA